MKNFPEFIKNCTDAWHTADTVAKELESNGFIPLNEEDSWDLSAGGKYYVMRNMSSVIAFKVPEFDFKGFTISAAHGESPSFKIKANPTCTDNNYIRLNTEVYGGPILSSWLDRPLSVSGRIVVKTNVGIKTKLVDLKHSCLVIPSLAPHLDQSAKCATEFNIKRDTPPLFAMTNENVSFMKKIAEAANVCEEDIAGFDLMLYNNEDAIIWGTDNEFISAPRLDDLQCTFALLKGFARGSNLHTTQVFCVFDNEEVGSGTKQGAKSTFLSSTLERISLCCGGDIETHHKRLANSFMVSADNAHAIHPNRREMSDENNYPEMNQGVVIKYNAAQRYTTDAVSEAVFKSICEAADIPYQTYANRSDLVGGSTLGNLATEKTSVNTIDVGLAQLSMHSAYETAGTKDIEYLKGAITKFYDSYIEKSGDNYHISYK